jgi:hypothetical protein
VGHCRFICVTRNPLDVLVSVKDLCDGMDQFLPEFLPYIRRHGSLFDAFAEAWVEQTERLDAFVTAHSGHCFVYRYEDLVTDPANTLTALMAFMEVEADVKAMIDGAFRGSAKVGLGDWRTYETKGVMVDRTERGRSTISRSSLARLVPLLKELMTRHGYAVPPVRKVAGRQEAMRQYQLSKHFIQNLNQKV